MQEGTFFPNSNQSMNNQQNSWEVSPASNPSQGFAGQSPMINPESVSPQKVNPVIYKSNGSNAF